MKAHTLFYAFLQHLSQDHGGVPSVCEESILGTRYDILSRAVWGWTQSSFSEKRDAVSVATISSVSRRVAQSAGAVEYIDCFSADPHNEFPVYDTKQSDGGVTVMLEV